MPDLTGTDLRRKLLAVGGGAGIALASMAGGSSAYASVVRFDNSAGDYTWFLEEWLDVTRAPLDQDGSPNASSFLQYMYAFGGDGPSGRELDFYGYGTVANNYGLVIPFDSGDEVGQDDFYSSYGWAAGARSFEGGGEGPQPTNDGWDVYVGSETPGYIGLRFIDDEEDNHFGWLKVLWNDPDERFDALAWAYETEDDTPIVIDDPESIPEPGTLALFALGAGALAVAARRRKRQESSEE